jgi:hypothetical protein
MSSDDSPFDKKIVDNIDEKQEKTREPLKAQWEGSLKEGVAKNNM